MEYVIAGLSFGLVVFKLWLDEKKEARWHKQLNDLINKKMANDFYDYVHGTKILKKDQIQTELFDEFAQQYKDRVDRGKVPPFINQKRPGVDIRPNQEY